DEELADEDAMHGPLVVLGIGSAHQKVSGGNASEVRQSRSAHRAEGESIVQESTRPRRTKTCRVTRMKLETFALERWQSTYENLVEFNLSESGVQPLTLGELIADSSARDALFAEALRYTQSNGTPPLREAIAALYAGATREHVQVTTGGSEANYLATWNLVEPGDEVVVMVPNYIET